MKAILKTSFLILTFGLFAAFVALNAHSATPESVQPAEVAVVSESIPMMQEGYSSIEEFEASTAYTKFIIDNL